MEIVFFYDTYAFAEIIAGNPAYATYTKEVECITTRLNLMELYYVVLRVQGKEAAELQYARFLKHCISFSNMDIKEACQFKFEHKSKNVSYIDCLGYVMALRRGAKFLTGDTAFKGLTNVEFVR